MVYINLEGLIDDTGQLPCFWVLLGVWDLGRLGVFKSIITCQHGLRYLSCTSSSHKSHLFVLGNFEHVGFCYLDMGTKVY